MLKYLGKKENLQQLFIGSLQLVVYTPILKVSWQQYAMVIWLFAMVYALDYRCLELVFWKLFFKKWVSFVIYCHSFIYLFFKTIVNKLFIKRLQLTTVEKKTLLLSLPFLGEIFLQTRTKLEKSRKGLLNSCKLQIALKSQRKSSNIFPFKDRLHFNLVSRGVSTYTCGR